METDLFYKATQRASHQHGVLTRRQLLQAGLTSNQIQHLITRHLVAPLHRGVYLVAGVPPSRETGVTAALLAAGPKSYLSGRTAAAVWKTPGFNLDAPELTVVGQALPRLDGVRLHRRTIDTSLDVVRHGIWRVTTPALTLLQLGSVATEDEVEKACEFAVLTGLVRPEQLQTVLDRFGGPGARGAATLRAILEARTEAPESELEWLLIGIIRRYCTFEPVRQHQVTINGKHYRLDLSVPELKIDIEGVGRIWHDGKSRVEADTRRRRALTAAGWAVLEYRWAECKARPKAIGAEIAATVQRRRRKVA
jgi:very-short-patch-repair endonuclease